MPASKEYTHVNWDKIRKRDEFLTKLHDTVEGFKIDKSFRTELNLYYIASIRDGDREMRQIPTDFSRKSFKKLASLFEENQAYKDRVVQIQAGLLGKYKKLQRLRSVAEAYIFKNYGKQMASLKSEAMRKTIMEDLLLVINKKIDEFDSIMETAELVKENLHNTHFVLTNLKDMAEHFLDEQKRSNI